MSTGVAKEARKLMRLRQGLRYQNALQFVVEAKEDARRVKQAHPEKKFGDCILEVACQLVDSSKFGG